MPERSNADAAAVRALADSNPALHSSEAAIPTRRIGSRFFLDARGVPHDQLAGRVAHLFKVEDPLVVIVFADVSGLDWGQANACNDAVVKAGGLLVDLGQYDFDTAVSEWSGKGRTRSLLPDRAEIAQRTTPADWSPYKSAFLSEAEFSELQRQIREHRDDGSVVS